MSPLSAVGRYEQNLTKRLACFQSLVCFCRLACAAEEIERIAGVSFTKGFSTENLMTSLNAVASGLGSSFFAAYVEEIAPKGVVIRPLDMDPVPHLDLLLAYRSDDRLPALEKLVSLVGEYSPFRMDMASRAESDAFVSPVKSL